MTFIILKFPVQPIAADPECYPLEECPYDDWRCDNWEIRPTLTVGTNKPPYLCGSCSWNCALVFE